MVGWSGSLHDMRIFKDAIEKYGDRFPHPPQGKFYLMDSRYPNHIGYLAPYKATKYHLPAHSSIRNVIERSFVVLKMKWRILLDLPSYRNKAK